MNARDNELQYCMQAIVVSLFSRPVSCSLEAEGEAASPAVILVVPLAIINFVIVRRKLVTGSPDQRRIRAFERVGRLGWDVWVEHPCKGRAQAW